MVIPADYDLHIAAIFSQAGDFNTGRRRLQRALTELEVGNIKTNLELINSALAHPGLGQPGGIKGPDLPAAQIFS
jgi:biotin carboxylase